MSEVKILTLDIETSPIQAYTWDTFNTNISNVQVIEPSRILMFGYKWNFQKKAQVITEWGSGGHSGMVDEMWTMLDEADIIVTYNGKSFDIPHINRELILAGLTPPSPYAHVDLYRVVRSKFKFTSGKLEWIVKQLGIGEKMTHEGFDLWKKVLAGDPVAKRKMEKYCARDVGITEGLYYELLPWISAHPNVTLITGDVAACTTCSSTNLQKRGLQRTNTFTFQRYQCNSCGSYSRERQSMAGTDLVALA